MGTLTIILAIGALCLSGCLASQYSGIELNLASLGKIAELYIDGNPVTVQISPASMSPYTAQTYKLDSMPKSIVVKFTTDNFLSPLLLADLKLDGKVEMTSGSDQWRCTSNKEVIVKYGKCAIEFGTNQFQNGHVDGIDENAAWISSEGGTTTAFCKYIADQNTPRTLDGIIEKLIMDLQGDLTDPLKALLNSRLDIDILADGLIIPRHIKQKVGTSLLERLREAMQDAMDRLRSERVKPIQSDDVFPRPKFGSKTCLWPEYTCTETQFRSFDGSCNNLKNPLYGRANIPYVRLLNSNYDNDDGILRDVDCGHDGCDTSNPACSPIPVPKNDPSFNQDCLKFFRSVGVHDIDCSTGQRQQMNDVSAFIDGSQIYGADLATAMNLRNLTDHKRGSLVVTHHPFNATFKDLLPQRNTGCALEMPYRCFRAGDGRVNEHHGLSTFHTVGHREHNRIEEVLHELNPHWDGERLFQESRKIVGAEIAAIAYQQFLPAILGKKTMKDYKLEAQEEGFYNGYDENVNPSIANHFATASFRYGHSTVSNNMETFTSTWDPLTFYRLRDQFFVPKELYKTDNGGIDSFMRGIVEQRSERCDRNLPLEVTDHLLLWDDNTKLRERTDLFSLNVRRGRDHGLPGYNDYREHCGLPRLTKFKKPPVFQEKSMAKVFRKKYDSVDDIDLFPGGIAEKPLKGGMVGETFACLLAEQFVKLRDGDRFWFENEGVFTEDQLIEIKKASLGKLFCDNSDKIQIMQPNVMEVPFREAFSNNDFNKYDQNDHGLSESEFTVRWNNNFNARVPCNQLPTIDLGKWQENMMYRK